MPGKSTKVKSGQVEEWIVNTIGSSIIPFFVPATLKLQFLVIWYVFAVQHLSNYQLH